MRNVYSFGKDSALALHKLAASGHTPVCLVTATNIDNDRSWTHGIAKPLADAASQSLGLPLIRAVCKSADYEAAFESALREAAALRAEACAFGDMDVDLHLEWNRARCAAAGLECLTPLWGMSREAAVAETLALGFEPVIKLVRKESLGAEFLGKTLTPQVVDAIRAAGADVCGENGEYHTFVVAGPGYGTRAAVIRGEILDLGDYLTIDLTA
ncbi:MAG: ATP-binding protein [Oscillospiraceae bacterium]|nr:ATP-binding protein [Oscillospiraceae bacterium]